MKGNIIYIKYIIPLKHWFFKLYFRVTESQWRSKYESLREALENPYDINIFFENNFKYYSDKDDFTSEPELSLARGGGDCDDYALFATDILQYHGYEAYFVGIIHQTGGHAVCVFKDTNNRWYHLGNWGLFGGWYTKEDVIKSVFDSDKIDYTIYSRDLIPLEVHENM